MKVAAVQFAPIFRAKSENLQALARMVVEAAKAGAKLIVLPELCCVGYSFMDEAEVRDLAECPHWLNDTMATDHSMYVFSTLAKKLGVAIAWGFAEVDPGTKKLYNSQILVCPNGTYGSYRKVNLWGNDYLWASPGDANPPVVQVQLDGKEWRIGLLICADVRDKSDRIEEFYEPGDADIVAYSANWGDGGFPAGKWVKFAQVNICHFVVSNRFGKEANNNFGEGGVCVIAPTGKVHCQGLRWNEPCVVYADIS